jgi:hypothetical protein
LEQIPVVRVLKMPTGTDEKFIAGFSIPLTLWLQSCNVFGAMPTAEDCCVYHRKPDKEFYNPGHQSIPIRQLNFEVSWR